ncbi:Dbl homology domain-containing protein [Exidia glandulosa HHB12029]|uniref:Dbl homology domain-containing protein n=1 Tax=Exidia glandulosa HHB12029 TaxID=1314781 RepID=A0A165GEK2_EXIGL|nr:Dbl homology domain-containing protein [Exidia glandulosa HHB12029]
MKALFSRFNRSSPREREIASLPALPEWPPKPKGQNNGSPSPRTTKPLPDLNLRSLPPITLEDGQISPVKAAQALFDKANGNGNGNGTTHSTVTTASTVTAPPDVQKKVAFISPPPSASALTGGPSSPSTEPRTSTSRKPGPLDTPPLKSSKGAHGEPRGSTSSQGPATSKVSLATSARGHPASLRPATSSPYHSTRTFHNEAASLRSGSPFSQTSTRTAVMPPASWSELAEDDLVSNLGQRERTRQEVLWEIVASEERYIQDLAKLRELFIEPLLHPYNAASPTLGPSPDPDDYFHREATPAESIEHLPIALRFLSPRSASGATDPASLQPPSTPPGPHPLRTETPVIPPADGESLDTEEDEATARVEAAKHNHPRSPYGTAARAAQQRKKLSVPFPTRSHASLPPPPRNQPGIGLGLGASTASLGRQNAADKRLLSDPARQAATGSPASRVLRKLHKRIGGQVVDTANGGIPPHLLPEDLRRVLEVLEAGIIPGHQILSEGLRKRYEEQYPLVRSLADVFVSNSHILHEYATYVLHLERALEQVDDALSNAMMKRPKKQDAADWAKFCKFLQTLEDEAAARSETGLAISLSKPFQRLLKYPLLFQNLLFHTDPSTFEYESTLLMVSEVETIVRSIEDEKIQKEERDKTRDIFARIDGLEKVKMLALPKPSRLLVEERQATPDASVEGTRSAPSSPPTSTRAGVKPKSSFKRFSDVLQPGNSSGIGGKKDQWLVVFNDVILRCQRTGTTTLPIASATSTTSSRTNSMPELQAKQKFSTNGRRASQGKPRNLYKFLKIETWDIGEVAKPREGIIHMADITRTRALSNAGPGDVPQLPEEDEDEEDGGAESDESDRKSKMSFSYWGADRVTLTTPRPKPGVSARGGRGGLSTTGTGVGRRAQIPSSYTNRESSANAKFGTRLVNSPDSAASGPRPASRRQQATGTSASSRRTPVPSASDDGDERTTMRSTKTPIQRPAWSGSTRITTAAPNPSPAKTRARTPSTSAATPPRLQSKPSTAASEDSGIGLYRQLVAQDPSLGSKST